MGATTLRAQQIKTGNGLSADGSNNLIVDLAANPGLTFSTGALLLLLDTNPGLQLGSGGLSMKLDTNPGLVLGSGGVKVELDTNSALGLGSGGLSVNLLTTKGDIFTFGSSNARLGVGADGTYLVADSSQTLGIKWATFTGLTTSNFVFEEAPSGSIDGSNATFTLANTPTSGTVQVYLNGVLQQVGMSNDYTISTNTITYNAAPKTGDILLASYMK